jgi:hypothetical protein
MHTVFWLEILKGKDHSEDLGTNGKIIMDLREIVDWMHVAQDRDRWRLLVK